MDLFVNNSDSKCVLSYDLYGNLYIKYNDLLYNLIINEDNLDLLKINKNKLHDFKDINIDHAYGSIKTKTNPLKAKINNSLEETNDDNIDYFPEDKLYEKSDISIDTDYMNSMDIDPMFIFYTNDKYIKNKRIYEQKKGFPFNSLYNFSIIDGNTDSTEIILSSDEFNNTCSYNITIYTVGLFKLNVIGKSQKIYKIIDDNNKLLIKC